MKGTFVPIPSGDLAVFVGRDPHARTVIGWIAAVETETHFDAFEFSLHTLKPVYIDEAGCPTQAVGHDYVVVRHDGLDRVG